MGLYGGAHQVYIYYREVPLDWIELCQQIGSEGVVMDKINKAQHDELIQILEELIKVIVEMRKEEKDYILFQNENEAREWIVFLKEHKGKEELKSLESEISERLFYKFDVQIGNSQLDNRRVELMKRYIFKSYNFLK